MISPVRAAHEGAFGNVRTLLPWMLSSRADLAVFDFACNEEHHKAPDALCVYRMVVSP